MKLKYYIPMVVGALLTALLLYAVTASAATTVCQIFNGCTGTSTAPSYGNVLVGNQAGGYDYVATSTFGSASSPGGTSGQVQYNAHGSFGGTSTTTLSGTSNQISLSNSPVVLGATPAVLSIPSLFSIQLASTTGLSALGNLYAGNGSATSTFQGSTTGTSTLQGFLNVLGANSTSTFSGGLAASVLNLTSSSATSTAANGIDISNGCFAASGVCLQTFIQNATAYKQAVNYATAAVLAGTPTYLNGTSGVGATLTEVGSGALVVDGQNPSAGQRVLVKNQADQTTNGIYTVTATGSGIASYILTRSTDYNQSVDIYAGTTVPVLAGGTANGDTQWTMSTTGTITVGSSNIVFIETSFGTNGTVTSVAASVPSFLSISGSPITTSGTLAISYSGTALPIANGGTAATSFTNANGLLFYTGSALSSAAKAIWNDTANWLGVGTSTPRYLITASTSTAPQLALTDGSLTGNPWTFRSINGNMYISTSTAATAATSSQTAVTIDTNGNLGIASSTPNCRISANGSGADFCVTSTGKIVGVDTANAFSGRITPTNHLILQTGTTTTWTATTSGAYVPFTVAPFAGTLQQIRCKTDASFVSVESQINGSDVTPGYFVASTTVGVVKFTAGNTFSAGDKISMINGTSTSAATASISCTLEATETP